MVGIVHLKLRVNDGFGISKVVTSRLQTRNMENRQKFEDVEFQALFDEDDSRIQKQLAQELGASQQTVSNRFRQMGTT